MTERIESLRKGFLSFLSLEWNIRVLSVGMLTGNLGLGMLTPFIPIFLYERGVSPIELTFLYSLLPFPSVLLSFPSGLIADKFGKKGVLVFGAFIFIFAPLIFAFANSLDMFILAFLLWGLGMAIMMPSYSVVIANSIPEKGRATAYGVTTTVSSIGSIIAPNVGGIILQYWGFQIFFFLIFVFVTMRTAIFLLIRETQIEKYSEGRKGSNWWSWILLRNIRPFLIPFIILGFLIQFAASICSPILSIYLKGDLGLDEAQLGTFFTIVALVNLLAQIPGGKLSDSIGRRPVIVLSFLGRSLLTLTFSMITQPSLALIFWVSATFMTGLSQPTITAFYMDPIPEKFRGTISGLLMGMAHVGMLIAPIFGGYLWNTFGITTPFQISAVLALLVMLIVIFGFPREKLEIDNAR